MNVLAEGHWESGGRLESIARDLQPVPGRELRHPDFEILTHRSSVGAAKSRKASGLKDGSLKDRFGAETTNGTCDLSTPVRMSQQEAE
jgi:hypothetical protein